MKVGDDRDQLGVSRLPMPPSDSPLVIDLPDGQKLVLGNMATGNVIEVATWRGTGRPDSRTSRLMLGMSTAESVAAQAESEKTNQPTTSNKFAKLEPLITAFRKIAMKSLPYLQGILRRIVSQIQALPLGRLTDLARGIPMPKMINSASQQVEISGGSDQEISDWLDSIVSKSKLKTAATVQKQAPLLNLGVNKVSASKPVTSKAGRTTKKAAKKRPAPQRKSRH